MLKIGVRLALVAGFYCAPVAHVSAQDSGASASLQSTEPGLHAEHCELHVWPGHDFHSVYFGWGHGGTIDGAAKGRVGYENVPHEPLSAPGQLVILKDTDIASALGLIGFTTVLHDDPLSSREIRTGIPRHAVPAPACYAELMIDDLVLQKNVLGGSALNVLYRYRRFDGETLSRSFGTYIQEPISVPDKLNTSSSDIVRNQLEAAFRKATPAFGTALQTPPRKKR